MTKKPQKSHLVAATALGGAVILLLGVVVGLLIGKSLNRPQPKAKPKSEPTKPPNVID